MDKNTASRDSWWQVHRPTTRRLVQLYAALLNNAYIKGFIDGRIYDGKAKYLCVPGLNCYSCPGAVGACPLGAIQNALAAAGHRPGWYVLGMIVLFGVILGRTICGWLCPMGLLQELLHKIPTPKIRKSKVTRILAWLKYGFLLVFVIAMPLCFGLFKDLPVPGFCKYICPAGTFEGAAGHLVNPNNTSMYDMLGLLFTSKWVILTAIGLTCIFCYRSFCRFICPLGAIYGLFNRFNIIGVKVDQDRCNGCGACVRCCGMDVAHVGDHECISCGKCLEHCSQGAISMAAGKITLKASGIGHAAAITGESTNERRIARILWGIALAGLCFALVWFNFLDPSVKKETVRESAEQTAAAETSMITVQGSSAENWESTALIGYETGRQLADFTLNCYDGRVFHLSDSRGKVVLINRWATWCAPCVKELPYFNDLYIAHRDDIAMIMIHPSMTVMDPAEWIAPYSFAMPFATDDEGDPVKQIVGGTSTLPQTIVLNRKGEVVYNSEQSVSRELLEALYEMASE